MENLSYRNHEIKITPDFTFQIDGPEITKSQSQIYFPSATEAKLAIDKAILLSEAEKTSNFKAWIRDSKGNQTQIFGIDRRSGKVKGVESGYIYPDVKWIAEALIEREKLASKLKELNSKLYPFQISTEITYGRIDAEDYSRKLLQLENAIKTRTEEANKIEQITEKETKTA